MSRATLTGTDDYPLTACDIHMCLLSAQELSATLRKQSIINLDRRTAKTKGPLIEVVISSGTYSIRCGDIP